MFKIAETIIAYIGLLLSPSPLKTPYSAFDKMIKIDPSRIGTPYSVACPMVWPAPMTFKMGFNKISRTTVKIIEMAIFTGKGQLV